MKFINDFAIALVQPGKYKELVNNSVWRVILYVIILTLISSVTLVVATRELYGILGEYYEKNIPEFTFENNTLTSNDTFNFDLAGMQIVLDTTKQLTKEDFSESLNGMLFDSDSLLIKQGPKIIEAKYSELTEGVDIKFTKASLVNYKDIAKLIINITVVFYVLLSIPLLLLGALFVTVIATAFAAPQYRMKFSKAYKLALYSRGLPIIVSTVLSMFVGKLPVFVSIFVSFVILRRAIFYILHEDKHENKEM